MTDSGTPTVKRGFNPVRMIAEDIASIGGLTISAIETLGGFLIFAGNTMLAWLFTRLPRRDTLIPNFYQIGVLSLPVVALTGTFIGMVLAVQSYAQFRKLRLETRLGAVINMSLVRELGPVLAATMLAGRVGSAMAAELGTMRVTEQIDALASMGANPIHYLVVPRFLGCLLLIPDADDHGRFHGRGRRASSTASTFWASIRTTIGQLASSSSATSICSTACSRASSSARRLP